MINLFHIIIIKLITAPLTLLLVCHQVVPSGVLKLGAVHATCRTSAYVLHTRSFAGGIVSTPRGCPIVLRWSACASNNNTACCRPCNVAMRTPEL